MKEKPNKTLGNEPEFQSSSTLTSKTEWQNAVLDIGKFERELINELGTDNLSPSEKAEQQDAYQQWLNSLKQNLLFDKG